MAFQVSASASDIQDVLKRFDGLRIGVQKKYLGASVKKVTKPYIPEVKALVAKGPTGNLKRSVGVLTEAKVRGKTQTAVLGFRRGDKFKKGGLGYHAWWIENGVKVRKPKNASMLRVPMSMAKKYPYLMGKVALIGAEGGGAAYFPEVAAVPGTGKFGQWADRTLPRIREQLVEELGRSVDKAVAENARRDAKGM
jgi:hypothetical protein